MKGKCGEVWQATRSSGMRHSHTFSSKPESPPAAPHSPPLTLSMMLASMLLMETGFSMMPRTHEPSQGAGHTRPLGGRGGRQYVCVRQWGGGRNKSPHRVLGTHGHWPAEQGGEMRRAEGGGQA